MEQESYGIYTLRYPMRHPLALQVFYVGMALHPTKRFIQHLQLEGENDQKTAILSDLKDKGFMPIMDVEISCTGKELATRLEAFYIEYYRAAGQPLVNKVLSLMPEAELGRFSYMYEQYLYKFQRFFLSPYSRWTIRFHCFFSPKRRKKELKTYEEELQLLLSLLKNRKPYPRPTIVHLANNLHITCRLCKAILRAVDEHGQVQCFICNCEQSASA